MDAEAERLEALFDDLFPLPRSITGPGLRESLSRLAMELPLEVESVPTGQQVFDWEIPPEWRIHKARLTGPDGEVYADFGETNLAVVNYSEPADTRLDLEELKPHLHTHPDVPDATPYVTSYYERNWGFCLPHSVCEDLPEGEYHAYIDSEFVDGELNYGHTILPGTSDQEILLSTYICHPSLANNELSGPLVLTALYNRLAAWENRHYTYRFVICPETIGSLAYLHRYGDLISEQVVAGHVLTCLGGDRDRLSYKMTRQEDTLIDDLVRHFDAHSSEEFEIRPFDPTNGSDERQYCSPGFNLPVGQLARTVYGEYDGYHNSHDTKSFMGIDTLVDSADVIERLLGTFEYAGHWENLEPFGEPMLSKRDLHCGINAPSTWSDSTDEIRNDEQAFFDMVTMVLNYSDGNHSLVEIANMSDKFIIEYIPVIERLVEEGLLARSD